ncbi:MAG: winged helix DNA-binding protein [Candidatus Nanohaloarchaea archaeon]
MSEELKEFLLHTKPSGILVKLNDRSTDNYASALSTEVDATYSHTVKILQRMEDYDLVEFEKKGRRKMISLTDRGERISGMLSELHNELISQSNTA